MENKTKTRTEQILTVMHILAWVAFVGYSIEAGAMQISYIVSCVNPEASNNLYQGLNLNTLREFSFWHYTITASFIVALAIMKAFVWLLVIYTISKINLMNPFTSAVAQNLEKISYVLLGAWIVGILSIVHKGCLLKRTGEDFGDSYSGEFLFMAGLVFIISQVFKRGVEIQSENELTV